MLLWRTGLVNLISSFHDITGLADKRNMFWINYIAIRQNFTYKMPSITPK